MVRKSKFTSNKAVRRKIKWSEKNATTANNDEEQTEPTTSAKIGQDIIVSEHIGYLIL